MSNGVGARPSEVIHKTTLEQLLHAHKMMMSTKFRFLSRNASSEEQHEYTLTLLQLQNAILELQNAKLVEIRDRLEANDHALQDTGTEMTNTLNKVHNGISVAIKKIGEFLFVIGQVVTLSSVEKPHS